MDVDLQGWRARLPGNGLRQRCHRPPCHRYRSREDGSASITIRPRFRPLVIIKRLRHGTSLDDGDELLGNTGPGEEAARLVGPHAGKAASETLMLHRLHHGDA